MKLNEKILYYRKAAKLSQEELAARVGVSRQAVSKWELDETMPDTENVIQLSRIFGVSCDYLLREEVDEQGAPLSAAPGEAHLDGPGWAHNASALSLAACAIGLLLALGGWIHEQTSGPLIIGLIIQILGVLLFELAAPRMDGGGKTARLTFYMAANWLLVPIPAAVLCSWGLRIYVRPFSSLLAWSAVLLCDLLLSGALTAALARLRRRQAQET